MSKLTDVECDDLQPLVAQVAISLKRRYPMLDREDLSQEGWVWCLTHAKQVRELLVLDDERQRERLLVYRISLGVRKWAEKEKAAALGYEPEDVHFYSNKELGALLAAALDYDAWVSAPETSADGPGNRQDPAVGGNWVATLSDVSRGFSALPETDRLILQMHFVEGLSYRELAPKLEVHHSTAADYVNRALERLHDQLGGERPDGFAEYTGSRRHMGNAQMNAITRSYE